MRTLLAGAALGTILVAPVGAPGFATQRKVATRGPVMALAADGDRAALVIGDRRGRPALRYGGCAGVVVWEPMPRRVVRLQRPCRPEAQECREGTPAVALAGTRAAWLRTAGCNALLTRLHTATLARPTPVEIVTAGAIGDAGYGTYVRRPVGDSTLIVFTIENRCDAYNPGPDQCPPGRKHGHIVGATLFRVGGHGPCAGIPRACSRIAKADGELSTLAVDAGRIAVRTEHGLSLLTSGGDVLREFGLTARQTALSGNRLAVLTAAALEVYDTDSGRLAARFPATRGLRLEDLQGDILVTASGRTVTLRRLGDGRTRTILAGGIAHAQLEPPGLFVSGARRVTFTPMRDVLRGFDG